MIIIIISSSSSSSFSAETGPPQRRTRGGAHWKTASKAPRGYTLRGHTDKRCAPLCTHLSGTTIAAADCSCRYTRSPSQDFRLFGPRPWKILAITYAQKTISEQPRPWRKSCERASCYGDRVYRQSRKGSRKRAFSVTPPPSWPGERTAFTFVMLTVTSSSLSWVPAVRRQMVAYRLL